MRDAYEYFTPSTLTEAVDLVEKYGPRGKVMAGGTDVMIDIKKGKIFPQALINVSEIKELKEIKVEGERLSIGAAVTFTEVIKNPLIIKTMPVLVEAASEIGSPLIRNLGTVGGNLGTASPAGDFITPLVALDAGVITVGPKGEQLAPTDQFLSAGGWRALRPGEIIKGINIDLVGWDNPSGGFIKLGRRNALAIARINLALIVNRNQNDSLVSKAVLAIGAVGSIPFRIKTAERAILEKSTAPDLAPTVIKEVQQEVARSLGNRPSAPYKNAAVCGVVMGALKKCELSNCNLAQG